MSTHSLSLTVCESFVFVVSSHAVSDRGEHLDERTDRRLSCFLKPEGSKIFADIFSERALNINPMLNYFLNCSKKALLGHPVFMFLGSSMTKSGKPIVEQQFA